ncbi:MAG: cell wall-binding repeat-containing protein, partial [Actinobacteria bacterium]|nr:cell wall-binding repeat-containing protein [Actinomycetota bacterium]
ADISAATKAVLTATDFDNVVIVGGIGVVSQDVEGDLSDIFGADNVERFSGDDRYQTSAEIAAFATSHGLTCGNIAVATGVNFPDALAGGPLCGKNASVLLLVDDTVKGLFCADTIIAPNKSNLVQASRASLFLGRQQCFGPHLTG